MKNCLIDRVLDVAPFARRIRGHAVRRRRRQGRAVPAPHFVCSPIHIVHPDVLPRVQPFLAVQRPDASEAFPPNLLRRSPPSPEQAVLHLASRYPGREIGRNRLRRLRAFRRHGRRRFCRGRPYEAVWEKLVCVNEGRAGAGDGDVEVEVVGFLGVLLRFVVGAVLDGAVEGRRSVR